MTPSQGPSQRSSIDHFQNGMVDLVYNFCSVICGPIELLLRPQYGSRYFPPIVQCLTAMMMIILPVIYSLVEGVSHMLPFMRFNASMGMFGLGTLSKLYFLGSFIHGLRIWRRMINPFREKNSMYEGPPLPFFRIFPLPFWFTRIVVEPVAVFALAITFRNSFILQPAAASFLMFSAVMLAMKQYCAWYMFWQFFRGLLDMANAGPIIAKYVGNSATNEELETIHLAGAPKNLPDDVRSKLGDFISRHIH
jgi:hypothetical protein